MSQTDAAKAKRLSDHARRLIEGLRADLSKDLTEYSCAAISFSGGLDSSLIAAIARESSNLSAYVVGLETSKDVCNAIEAAEILDIPLSRIGLDEDMVVSSVIDVSRIMGQKDPLTISFEIPLFLAMRNAKEVVVLSGQGSDELFGGYARYAKLDLDEFSNQRRSDIERVVNSIVPLEDRLAMACNKLIRRPFLCNHVISNSNDVPLDLIYPGTECKAVIREALRQLGFEELATREKKAAQYGSGVTAILKKAARREGMMMNEYIERLLS